MCGFINISGWFFGLISVSIAIYQFIEKEKYRKQTIEMAQTIKMKQTNNDGSTGYQANNMTVNNNEPTK